MFVAQRYVTVVCIALALISGALAGERASAQTSTRAPGDEILGEWWTENNEGRIRITRDKEGYYRGTASCCAREGQPALDVHNPKPELRNRTTVGIVIIWKLKYEQGEYAGGYVYNPRDGKTYRMEMKLLDHDTLKVRGYLGISLFGQSQIWRRAKVDRKTGAVLPPRME